MINLDYHPDLKLSYHVQGRNGYYAIDEYLNTGENDHEGCTRLVETFKTRKQAEIVCSNMNDLAAKINELRGL